MNKLTKFLLTIGAALCLLTACGGDDGPLEVYTLEESGATVVALDSILAEGEAVMTSIDAPTDAAAQAGLPLSHTYHYGGMEDPAALAARYIAILRAEQGFTPVDDEIRELADEPNLETLSGSLTLAKKVEDSDIKQIHRVIVAWSEYAVAVQVAQVNGRIQPPPEPEKPAAEAEAAAKQPTSMMEQLDFFKKLNPEKLGLVGNDMNDYSVIPQQGWVLVDGISCREIMIYLEDAQKGTKVYMGTYFLSSDMQNMYKKTDAGTLVVVNDFQ